MHVHEHVFIACMTGQVHLLAQRTIGISRDIGDLVDIGDQVDI